MLASLQPDARVAWALAAANVTLAAAQFVEPVLFGRIIDTIAKAQGGVQDITWHDLIFLLAMWIGFALFIIVCSTWVVLQSDRLSYRHSQRLRTEYFEHVLQLPMSYHSGAFRRLMKIMLTGTTTIWGLWLSLFRGHLTSFVWLIVLLPLTLFINWRFGLLLITLAGIFACLIVFVLRRTDTLQSKVEGQYSTAAEHATDALGNIALVQSFARIEAEVGNMRRIGAELLKAQMPVLSWWALVSVLTLTSVTLTLLAILIVGIFLFRAGSTTVGEIVMFMSFATLVIGKLDSRAVCKPHDHTGTASARIFRCPRHCPDIHDRPMRRTGRLCGRVGFST